MPNKPSGKPEQTPESERDAEAGEADRAEGSERADDDRERSEPAADDAAPSAASDADDSVDTPAQSVRAADAKSKQGSSKRSKKRVRPEPATLTETEIDSPSRQTLGMLSVVAAATLVMWAVGRSECNYREVGEGMKPRATTLEERTHTPKDIAFAFQHALGSYDFATAAKVSTGSARALVDKQKSACGSECEDKRSALAKKVQTMSELLKRTSSHALARVWSDGGDTPPTKHLAVVKRDGRAWKVESYERDTGRDIELPGDAPPLPEQTGMPEPPALGSSTSPGAARPSARGVLPMGHLPAPGAGVAERGPSSPPGPSVPGSRVPAPAASH